jgi:hypothetical protein
LGAHALPAAAPDDTAEEDPRKEEPTHRGLPG